MKILIAMCACSLFCLCYFPHQQAVAAIPRSEFVTERLGSIYLLSYPTLNLENASTFNRSKVFILYKYILGFKILIVAVIQSVALPRLG